MDNWNGIGSLLIACIEIILLLNLLFFSDRNRINNTANLVIFLLMIYQAFEFLICWAGFASPLMVYLAFVDISFLPALNLILIFRLLDYRNKAWGLIFLPAISFVIYYAFVINQFKVASCAVLYASYYYPLGELYGTFYYLPIVISMILLVRIILKNEEKKKKLIAKVLLTGNVIISIPVITGFILMFTGNYYLVSKMESIMCKFAFFYTLSLGAVSLYNSKRNNGRNDTQHIPDN